MMGREIRRTAAAAVCVLLRYFLLDAESLPRSNFSTCAVKMWSCVLVGEGKKKKGAEYLMLRGGGESWCV